MSTSESLFDNPGRTKLSLVSFGVALPHGLHDASRWISQANATETVIDILFPSGHFATVPLAQPYTRISPFQLIPKGENGEATLVYGAERMDVQMLPAPKFYQEKTRSGARMGSFASLHENLLMLYPCMGCGYFANTGDACQYCQYDSMLNEVEPPLRDPLELVEVVHAALKEREIDTVYLYNGYAPGDDVGLDRLVPVIALLRRHLGHRQIALETVAPKNVSILDELYSAGLDVFICNLEVYDEERFAVVCPGKARDNGQKNVKAALEHARKVFRSGSVVSHLIVGLEPIESTIAGMQDLVSRGIVPLLQPFRPVAGTPLDNHPLPSREELEKAFVSLYRILQDSNFPTHRLRKMGRVLTPMESRVLDGSEPTLEHRFALSNVGNRIEGWLDSLRRHLLEKYRKSTDNFTEKGERPSIRALLARSSLPFGFLFLIVFGAFQCIQLDPPEGLSEPGWRALVVFGLCLVLWVTQLLPLPITSILGLALLPLLDVLPSSDVYAMFGNKAVFFILGAFILAAGIMKSGLSEHLALEVFQRVGTSSRKLLLAMLLLPATMSCFMPEHAVAAVLLPIAWAIVHGLGLKQGDRFGAAIFLALAWGAIIGGVMTLLGGARGPLAMAIVEQMTGRTFSFLDWTSSAAPLVLGMLAIALVILMVTTPFHTVDMEGAQERIRLRQLELGRMTFSARLMGGLMGATMILWIFFGKSAGLAVIALLGVVCMFALRIVSWKEIQSHIDWGVVLMYGGAIAVASALEKTGAASWLATSFWPEGLSGWMILVALALLTLILTEAISNAACVAILLPFGISLGMQSNIDPVITALSIGIVSGFAFILPMGTPANAMVYGTGYVELRQMIRYGILLMISTLLLFALFSRFWWPVIGFGV